jgi:uncharacterized membrane protein YgdD (TMEM256/DUF423 family)
MIGAIAPSPRVCDFGCDAEFEWSRTMNAIAWGAILAGLGVAAGAFGAHGLEGRVEPSLLEVFETGARYQIIHALALTLIGLARPPRTGSGSGPFSGQIRSSGGKEWLDRAAWSFVIGIVLFSGSLYLMTLTGQRWLGAVTPLGGLGFLTGWTCFAIAGLRGRNRG